MISDHLALRLDTVYQDADATQFRIHLAAKSCLQRVPAAALHTWTESQSQTDTGDARIVGAVAIEKGVDIAPGPKVV